MKELYIIPFLTIFKVIDFPHLPNLVFFQLIHVLLNYFHEIQTVFDENPTVDIRKVFLDISKAFDKVWHDGIIFKLKSYGIEDEDTNDDIEMGDSGTFDLYEN